jgi:hypothetical protein
MALLAGRRGTGGSLGDISLLGELLEHPLHGLKIGL